MFGFQTRLLPLLVQFLNLDKERGERGNHNVSEEGLVATLSGFKAPPHITVSTSCWALFVLHYFFCFIALLSSKTDTLSRSGFSIISCYSPA